MKVFMDFDEYQAIKEKRIKKIKAKQNYGTDDDLEFMKKKLKNRKAKTNKSRNNYKKFQYDYQEDSYELDYDIDEFK